MGSMTGRGESLTCGTETSFAMKSARILLPPAVMSGYYTKRNYNFL